MPDTREIGRTEQTNVKIQMPYRGIPQHGALPCAQQPATQRDNSTLICGRCLWQSMVGYLLSVGRQGGQDVWREGPREKSAVSRGVSERAHVSEPKADSVGG